LETLRREKMDAAAQRQREAERLAKAEQEKKLAEERTRLEMEAKKKADVPQARRDAEAKKKAEAERAAARKKEEADRIAAERKRLEEAARPQVAVAPPAPPPAPPKAAEPDLIKQAGEASKRGDDAESLALYRKAANAGNAEARFRLGEIFAAGRGVTQNNTQAYIWLSLAANAGHAGAKARRDQVAKALQPAEIQQADRVVRQLSVQR
jgi:hypothetical protein